LKRLPKMPIAASKVETSPFSRVKLAFVVVIAAIATRTTTTMVMAMAMAMAREACTFRPNSIAFIKRPKI